MRRYDLDIAVPDLHYNRKFAVRDLESSISGLIKLSGLRSGAAYSRAVGRAALELLDEIEPVGGREKQLIINEINTEEIK